MSTKFEQFREEEKAISLSNLCVYLLKKWKAMLVGAVVCAVVACAAFAIMGYQTYKTAAANSAGQTLDDIVISDEQKEIVHMKINNIANFRENIEEYEYYFNNSIKVKLNPNNVYQGVVSYIFSGESGKVMEAALECEKKIFAIEACEEMAARLSEPTDVAMLKEVFWIDRYFIDDNKVQVSGNEDSHMEFSIYLRHYNEEDCEAMVAFVEERMEELSASLAQESELVSITKASRVLERVVDRSLAPLSKDIRAAIKNAYEEIAHIEYNMNDEQRPYYEYLTNEMPEENDQAVASKSLTDFIDVKMMALGAVAGVLCVAAFLVVVYLINGRIRSKDELQSWTDLHVIEWKNNAELAAAFILGIALKNGMNRIYLSGTLEMLNEASMQSLKAELEAGGCKAVVGKNILKDAKAFEEATECGCVVLFEKCNVSKEKDLKDVMLKTASCGIDILGVVLEK